MDALSRHLYDLLGDFGYTVGCLNHSHNFNVFEVYFDMDYSMDNNELFLKLELELEPHGFHVYRLIQNIGTFWAACIIALKEE